MGEDRREASAVLRGGITRRGSVANRNFANAVARHSVPLTLRDRTALAIRRQAERDATIGKYVVKYAARNIPITIVDNSPHCVEHVKGRTHEKNTTVVPPFPECCTACSKCKNGNYPTFNSFGQWAAHNATKEHKSNQFGR